MKAREDLIKQLEEYMNEYVVGFDAANHMRRLIDELKVEEENDD